MYQNFIPTHYPSCFRVSAPTLTYSWKKKVGETFSPPRILHSHASMVELFLITGGTTDYTIGQQRYAVKEGDIIVVNAGVLHDEDARLAASTTVFGIGLCDVAVVDMPDNALLPTGDCPVIPLGDCYDTVRDIMSVIHALLSDDAVQYAEACQMMASGLVSMLVRLFQQNATPDVTDSRSEQLTARIRAYIDAHYSEDITLQAIGDALHVNRYYLAHVFKESTGYSPMQYVTRLRIGKAQALLTETSYPIAQIAGMAGYDNPSHFNAMFTKYIGMSPGKYRKTFLSAEHGK